MKVLTRLIFISSFILLFSCSGDDGSLSEADYSSESATSDGGQGQGDQSGLITAGEWNDLDNWEFWNGLLNGQDYSDMTGYWDFYTNNRISIELMSSNTAVVNAKIELLQNENIIWTSRTDNYGKAELWISLFQSDNSINLSDLKLKVNDKDIPLELKTFEDGINEINIDSYQEDLSRVEVSFIVDATGSMTDELEFLKDDLKSVIQSVQTENSEINILISTVFYRDEGDDYLVKKSDFTSDIDETINFINQQSANGGGDFPEAVHSALNAGINDLQWSTNAKTRIAFLLLDAPPHYTTQIKNEIHSIISVASEKGIKVIPITASGIDKKTEFLMRFLSISTNGTYVFITNDSGIGNDHIEASVGDYQVEYLNDLLVRLIKKYSE